MVGVRFATLADVEDMRRIAEGTWWETYSAILSQEQIAFMLAELYAIDTISEQIKTGSQHYLLLMEDDKAVAFAAYAPRVESKDTYKLHKLYCLPQTQGKGYGKILMDAVINNIKASGGQVLELNVNRYNKALVFYEKMGFRTIREEDVPIGPYWMNDYVMCKQL
jgi:GNAT superfamily N-acetyltransferase